MKAKCPYCQEGCDQCEGGLVDVSLPPGHGDVMESQTVEFEPDTIEDEVFRWNYPIL